MKEMAGATTKNVVYKSLRPSQILGSEKMVTCVIEVLSEEYLNPFSVSLDENLCNLSSGVPVEDELANKISCTERKVPQFIDVLQMKNYLLVELRTFMTLYREIKSIHSKIRRKRF